MDTLFFLGESVNGLGTLPLDHSATQHEPSIPIVDPPSQHPSPQHYENQLNHVIQHLNDFLAQQQALFQKHLGHIQEKLHTNPEEAKHELQLLTHHQQQVQQIAFHVLDAIQKIIAQQAKHTR